MEEEVPDWKRELAAKNIAKREAIMADGDPDGKFGKKVQYPGDDTRTQMPVEGVPGRMLTREQYEARKGSGVVLGMGSIGMRSPGEHGGWQTPLEAEASSIFSTIDIDKSGNITPSEFAVRMSDFGMGQAAIDTLFCKMDTDTDNYHLVGHYYLLRRTETRHHLLRPQQHDTSMHG